MLRSLRAVYHPGSVRQGPALQQLFRRHREILHLLRQGAGGNIQVKAHRQPVVMAGGKGEYPRVLPAQIQLHVAGGCVAHQIVPHRVLHPPLPAVVDGQHPALGDKAAIIALHVKIVEAEHHTGEYLVDGHCPVPRFIAELPDPAILAVRQQAGSLPLKHLLRVHIHHLFELATANFEPSIPYMRLLVFTNRTFFHRSDGEFSHLQRKHPRRMLPSTGGVHDVLTEIIASPSWGTSCAGSR